MSISALPPVPQPTDDTATFNTKAFALVAALPGFVDEANALGATATADAAAALVARVAAELAETGAEAARDAANVAAAQSAQSAGAASWVAGSYATGAVVYSPSTGLVYRRKSPGGSSPTDPGLDPTNWRLAVLAAPLYRPETDAAVTGEINVEHGLQRAGAQDVLMPHPDDLEVGDVIGIKVQNGRTDNRLLLTGGAKFNGEEQPDDILVLDDPFARVGLRWTGATYGWSD